MKKVTAKISGILLLGLLWYLFVKPYDYTIRVKANTIAGTVNQTLKFWDLSLDTVQKIKQNKSIYNLTQKLRFGDSIHTYNWKIKPLTDSTSRIIVNVKDIDNSLKNKINVPFSDTNFEKRSRKTVLDFMSKLNEHLDKFKVTIEGEAEIPSKYVAYLPVKSTQLKKVGGMMKNISYIEQTLLRNNIKLDGLPMLEITNWQMDTDSLSYNFCYPVIKSDSLPQNTDLKYKRIFKKKALKAEYNGNYITSDRAWYALLDYAHSKNISVSPTPIEIFYSNPSTGGDELSWKAEIFLPIVVE